MSARVKAKKPFCSGQWRRHGPLSFSIFSFPTFFHRSLPYISTFHNESTLLITKQEQSFQTSSVTCTQPKSPPSSFLFPLKTIYSSQKRGEDILPCIVGGFFP
eukprot:TRINITY_DN44380_c0_g1_i2.p1 TRINITY_DN44380_c0_g1~~TRINITY_DN44380_c0_g1_i2.p1  ORF type:complete len:103 (-),score=12.33 TRINITY_DN44380_c0_g1_i2:543-851(-)